MSQPHLEQTQLGACRSTPERSVGSRDLCMLDETKHDYQHDAPQPCQERRVLHRNGALGTGCIPVSKIQKQLCCSSSGLEQLELQNNIPSPPEQFQKAM